MTLLIIQNNIFVTQNTLFMATVEKILTSALGEHGLRSAQAKWTSQTTWKPFRLPTIRRISSTYTNKFSRFYRSVFWNFAEQHCMFDRQENFPHTEKLFYVTMWQNAIENSCYTQYCIPPNRFLIPLSNIALGKRHKICKYVNVSFYKYCKCHTWKPFANIHKWLSKFYPAFCLTSLHWTR